MIYFNFALSFLGLSVLEGCQESEPDCDLSEHSIGLESQFVQEETDALEEIVVGNLEKLNRVNPQWMCRVDKLLFLASSRYDEYKDEFALTVTNPPGGFYKHDESFLGIIMDPQVATALALEDDFQGYAYDLSLSYVTETFYHEYGHALSNVILPTKLRHVLSPTWAYQGEACRKSAEESYSDVFATDEESGNLPELSYCYKEKNKATNNSYIFNSLDELGSKSKPYGRSAASEDFPEFFGAAFTSLFEKETGENIVMPALVGDLDELGEEKFERMTDWIIDEGVKAKD